MTGSYQGLFLTIGVVGLAVGVVYWVAGTLQKRVKGSKTGSV